MLLLILLLILFYICIIDSTLMMMGKSKVRLAAIIPQNGNGYVKYTPFIKKPTKEKVSWEEVMNHIGNKLLHEGSDESLTVLTVNQVDEINVLKTDILLLIGLDENPSNFKNVSEYAKAVVVFNCSKDLYSIERYGDFIPSSQSDICSKVYETWDNFVKNPRAQHRKMYDISQELWQRNTPDDWKFLFLTLIDTFSDFSIKSVKSVTSTENTQLSQFDCMLKNCKDELINCFKDPKCRAALDCLNKCRGNDQVCSYRCITSHETPAFEKFALCILQRNNCMNNTAVMPIYPDPPPLTTFRGEPLTHEIAEQIFIGHLNPRLGEVNDLCPNDNENWSWKVVCGQNPAYDYFSCQHQIFYYDAQRKSSMWYDPVFKVTTIYGEEVWRRRHYKVRRGNSPGQFFFSVLDNGVTSNEFWRIVDCDDNMSWAVFYYSGCAAAAGTAYSGSLLVTKDGQWPVSSESTLTRIYKAFDKFEILPWELFEVNNNDCDANCKAGPPPIGYK